MIRGGWEEIEKSAELSGKNLGYASRASATDEEHPIFNGESLNLKDDEIEKLKSDLDLAQDNGNNLIEAAFSIRGDWLVENGLYDPKHGTIDQRALKQAEQSVVRNLFEKGFPLPLGENKNDVVWFGVIHQDTDHLNMHIWFAKKSKETRNEMIHSSGSPKGKMKLSAINDTKRKFISRLTSSAEQERRADIYQAVAEVQSDIKLNFNDINSRNFKNSASLQEIWEALPKDMAGKWMVGNADLNNLKPNTKMFNAHKVMNEYIDKLFETDLKNEFNKFMNEAHRVDEFLLKDNGKTLYKNLYSTQRVSKLKKQLANSIYREFNQQVKDEKISIEDKNLGESTSTFEPFPNIKKHEHRNIPDIQKGHDKKIDNQKFVPKAKAVSLDELSNGIKKNARSLTREAYEDASSTRKMLRAKEREEFELEQESNGYSR
ncbi:hypothetical protein IV73_GL001055 [Weissella kandleri]|uniref:Uncharacterized protein n=2 Tax=Weissella kandleri TaxID=1616 RepID=A0A0R2JBX5_9LACO|nr:hypothetical protein IV73_GL001055 [Weissella kandleri]